MMNPSLHLSSSSSFAPLIIYLLCAFAFTWTFHFQIVRKDLSTEREPGRLFYALGLPGPTLSAIAISIAFSTTHHLWQSLLQWPIGIQWWLLAVFLLPAIYLLATVIHYWSTGQKAKSLFHRPKGGWPVLLLAQLFVVCSEEIGWRGFAMPLLTGIFGSLGGAIILGAIWALWHLPMFRVPTSHQKGSFWRYMYTLIAWSIIMTLLVTRSGGSILPAMAFHAAANISYFIMDIPPEAERTINVLLSLVSLLLIVFLPSPWIAFTP
jgi:membrane protease YdiL (CAAX protease family)